MNKKIVTIEDVRRINEQMIRGEKTKLPKEDELFLKKVQDVIGNINSDKISQYFVDLDLSFVIDRDRD